MQLTNPILKPHIIGQLFINLPCLLFILWASWMFKILGVFMGLYVVHFWWGFWITKWQIWAFKITEEDYWIDLEKKAFDWKLFWYKKSFFKHYYFEKITAEFRSFQDRVAIEKIKKRIAELDRIENVQLNFITPKEIRYNLYYLELEYNFVLSSALMVIFIRLMFFSKTHFVLGLLAVLCVLPAYDFEKLKYVFQKRDRLIINEEGIQSTHLDIGCFLWEEINAFSVDEQQQTLVLDLKKDKKNIKIPLYDFNIKDYNALEMSMYIFMQ